MDWHLPAGFEQNIVQFTGCSSLQMNQETNSVSDAVRVGLLKYRDAPSEVILVGNLALGDIVGRNTSNALLIRSKLSPKIAAHVVVPLSQGVYQDCRFAIFKRYQPLSTNSIGTWIDNFIIGDKVLAWHQAVINESKEVMDTATAIDLLPRACKFAADELNVTISREFFDLGRIEGGVKLLTTIEHGDFWRGNILKSGKFSDSIKIIDWAGARLNGQPCFDLVRCLISFRIPKRRIRSVLDGYMRLLEFEPPDLIGSLLLSLLHLSENLGHFPRARFIKVAEETLTFLITHLRAREAS